MVRTNVAAALMAPTIATPAELAHERLLEVLWFNMTSAPRRALCALVYIEDDYTRTPWASIPVADRVRLIRSMRLLAELSADCARTLERAHALVEFRP